MILDVTFVDFAVVTSTVRHVLMLSSIELLLNFESDPVQNKGVASHEMSRFF